MDSFWAGACGCQADDGCELLKAFLKERREIFGAETARFLGCDLEVIQPLLTPRLEEGVAAASEPGAAGS